MHSQNLQALHDYFQDLVAVKAMGQDLSLSLPLLQQLTDVFGAVAEDARQMEKAAVKLPYIPDRRSVTEVIPPSSNIIVFQPNKKEPTDDLVS